MKSEFRYIVTDKNIDKKRHRPKGQRKGAISKMIHREIKNNMKYTRA